MRKIIWDIHVCPPRDVVPVLEQFRAVGFTAVTLNAGGGHDTLETVVRTLSSWRRQIRAHPDRYILAPDANDLRSKDRLAITFDIEGAFPIGDQLDLVDVFYDLGVRWMSFVYNKANLVGGGCHDEEDRGLTSYGRKLVEHMDRIGMLKCCSHAGYKTTLDVFEMSAVPSIFSHSNPRALVDHERNIPDELIRACAAKGGVVGINGVNYFLGTTNPTAEDVFRHIDYLVNLVGPEHVGIGLDTMLFGDAVMEQSLSETDSELWPQSKYNSRLEIVQPEILPPLIDCMQRAGYTEPNISGILGENFYRVVKQVWKQSPN